MIPDSWYPVVGTAALRRGRVAGVRRLGRDWVLWRDADGVARALPDRCPHRAARLSAGRVTRGCIECPYHGLRFDGAGRCVEIPAQGPDRPVPKGLDLEPAVLRERHGLVWMWYGTARADLPELPWIADVDPPPGPVCTRTLSAPVSYLRVMENMTDVAHFAFVHRGFLPVGRRIVGLEASVEGDVIRMSGTLAADSPRGRDVPFSVRIRMPTVATFEILPGVQFVVIVTPVDRDRCWMWARYSQRFVPAWLGGGLVTRLVAALDLHAIFRRQDIPVLAGQRLDDPGDISGYRLLEMDRGASLYFSLRRRALARAAAALESESPCPPAATVEKGPSLSP